MKDLIPIIIYWIRPVQLGIPLDVREREPQKELLEQQDLQPMTRTQQVGLIPMKLRMLTSDDSMEEGALSAAPNSSERGNSLVVRDVTCRPLLFLFLPLKLIPGPSLTPLKAPILFLIKSPVLEKPFKEENIT